MGVAGQGRKGEAAGREPGGASAIHLGLAAPLDVERQPVLAHLEHVEDEGLVGRPAVERAQRARVAAGRYGDARVMIPFTTSRGCRVEMTYSLVL